MAAPATTPLQRSAMTLAAKVRVLFADTDQMGVVYHGSYLRYLELARVELCRGAGLAIPTFEPLGLGLPVTELSVRYRAPARYDDHMSLYVAVSLLTAARVHFQYVVTVEPGDRVGLSRVQELLWAETRHACIDLEAHRPTRLPEHVVEGLKACYASAQSFA